MKLLLGAFIFLIPVLAGAQEEFNVYFDTGKGVPDQASSEKLRQWIENNPDAVITNIYGYTDSTGSAGFNLSLSTRRAKQIYGMLEKSGIRIGKIEVKGLGITKDNNDAAQNRRVTLTYNKPVLQKPSAAEEISATETPNLTDEISTLQKGDKLLLRNLNFKGGTDEVQPFSMAVLEELLIAMENNPNLKIDIQGHICCREKDYNLLSEARARAIYKYLIYKGIDKKRLSYHGFEGKMPIYPIPEENESQREANRRVEIEIVGN